MRESAKRNSKAESARLVPADSGPFARLRELQIQMVSLHGEIREADLVRELAEVKRKHFGAMWREELVKAIHIINRNLLKELDRLKAKLNLKEPMTVEFEAAGLLFRFIVTPKNP